jgi:limonene-1,2-epoxide hydrolase
MSEMVERVARAIFNEQFLPADVKNGTADRKWIEWPVDKIHAERRAIAAIAAMREPTSDMIKAMGERQCWEEFGVQKWTAMINAALAP